MTDHNAIAPKVNSTGTGRRIARRRTRRRIAFGWYGGKFSHLDFLLPLIPRDAVHFCDVFGGSAAVILNLEPFSVETYNDIDSELVNFFEALRNQGPRLIKAIGLTPFSREELARACTPQAGNYVENGEITPLDTLLYPIFRAAGLKLRNRIIWHFGHGLHCSKRLSGRYETINWWTKGDAYTWKLDPIRVPAKYPGKKHFKGPRAGQLSGNPKGKNPSDLWQFPNVKSNHPEKTIHPCQFPVELVERLILSMTNEGDAVFDPYIGVGSTAVAARMHGRAVCGCDTDQRYIEIAHDRIRRLEEGRLKTRPMGKPIYDPALPNGGHW